MLFFAVAACCSALKFQNRAVRLTLVCLASLPEWLCMRAQQPPRSAIDRQSKRLSLNTNLPIFQTLSTALEALFLPRFPESFEVNELLGGLLRRSNKMRKPRPLGKKRVSLKPGSASAANESCNYPRTVEKLQPAEIQFKKASISNRRTTRCQHNLGEL